MKSIIQTSSTALLAAALCAGCSSGHGLVKKSPEATSAAATASSNNANAASASPLKTVYFAYDRADLTPETLKDLRDNVAWLKAHPDVRVKVEGRCDDRGTEEYNLALGQRRAGAVKQYYVHAGIRRSRVSAVSYGKDKPVCDEDNDSCWAQNRQADGAVRPARSASK